MKKLENYILDHIEPEDPVLQELSRETHLKVIGPRRLTGHWQGQLLTMISKMIRPSRILELGTFTGYSAICLAKGLEEGGQLITVEENDELKDIANKYFQKADVADRIIQLTGPALEIIPKLNGSFDMVFIDADKREYPDYYRALFPRVVRGGYILADNTLWSGKLFKSPSPGDAQTRGIIEFNKLVRDDVRVEKVILPLRDGMTITRKK